ncbi:hypothetical protein COSO111634_15995 [Corallococcus soli]
MAVAAEAVTSSAVRDGSVGRAMHSRRSLVPRAAMRVHLVVDAPAVVAEAVSAGEAAAAVSAARPAPWWS